MTPRLASAAAEGRKVHVGIFGDSFGDGIHAALYKQLPADQNFEVHKFSHPATGFTRYRSIDLLDDTRRRIDQQPVDVAVLTFGANDMQGIYLDGKGAEFMSDRWKQIVSDRVGAVVALLRERGAAVYWVGLPRMRDPAYDRDVQAMNAFYTERMRALNVPFIDTLAPTVDASGAYAPYLMDSLKGEKIMARTNDGIHMTITGYYILTRAWPIASAARCRTQAAGPRAAPPAAAPGAARKADAAQSPVARACVRHARRRHRRIGLLQHHLVRRRPPRAGRGQAARGPIGRKPVHILQIGDSHTAGDTITHGLRTRLQARYGNGGRGVLAAGRPYAGYLTFGVTASESAGWRSNVIFGSRWQPNGPALGLSGFTRTTARPGETLGLTTDGPEFDFDRAVVCALVRPGGGIVTLRMGEARENWSLQAPAEGVACRTIESQRPVSSASITTLDDGPVSITSFGTFRRTGGVVVSNVGVVGAQLQHFGRTDDVVLREELAAYRPDLIILAYGTNEGFSGGKSADYEAQLRQQVARIRRHAGADVPIMLLGPPDAASRNASRGASCGAGWHTPNLLGEVRATQRRVARELGLGFWDWEGAMGGRCASQAWLSRGLMRGDMVHFTRQGGDRIGAMIFADLERAAAAAPAAPVAPAFTHPDQPQEPVPPVRRRP
jgi:hypothetical protein